MAAMKLARSVPAGPGPRPATSTKARPRLADTLVSAAAVSRGDRLPAELRPYADQLRDLVVWMYDYLANPHPDLGRSGVVCPFARNGLAGGTCYLTVWPGRPEGPEELVEPIRELREWYLSSLPPTEGKGTAFKAAVTVFPDLTPADWAPIIEAGQVLLKTEFVTSGLMFGEFHGGPPDKPGLWNPDFRPLVSPLPLLTMRQMMPTDIAFIDTDPQHFRAYQALYGRQVPARLRDRYQAAADRFQHEATPGADK